MTRIRSAVVAAGAVIAAAATTTAISLTAASASPAPHAVPHSGAIAFVTGGDQAHPIVLAHGAINAHGKDDANHDNYDVFTFANGSFRAVHPDSQSTFVPTVNKKSCYATFVITGKFTLSHGTGAYAGIKGSGTYRGNGYAFLKRTKSGACNMNAEPSVELFTVAGKGKLS